MNIKRLIGKVEGEYPGPLVVFVAAVHGNEDSGLYAVKEVFQTIQEDNIPIRGKILGLVGNMKALEAGKRYIDYDLNRCWYDDHIHALRFGRKTRESSEDHELLDLLDWIHDEEIGHYSHRVCVDLHETSADNGVFIVLPEGEKRLDIPRSMHIPMIFGLEKKIEGTLLNYFPDHGFLSFAFEGGKIGSPRAKGLHKTGIWDVLFASGSILIDREEKHHDVREYLIGDHMPHPPMVRIVHRHAVNKQDEFRMLPGYTNFQPVVEGEQLAVDKKGPVYAPMDGMIIMPLYQQSGNDGFFIGKEINKTLPVNQLRISVN